MRNVSKPFVTSNRRSPCASRGRPRCRRGCPRARRRPSGPRPRRGRTRCRAGPWVPPFGPVVAAGARARRRDGATARQRAVVRKTRFIGPGAPGSSSQSTSEGLEGLEPSAEGCSSEPGQRSSWRRAARDGNASPRSSGGTGVRAGRRRRVNALTWRAGRDAPSASNMPRGPKSLNQPRGRGRRPGGGKLGAFAPSSRRGQRRLAVRPVAVDLGPKRRCAPEPHPGQLERSLSVPGRRRPREVAQRRPRVAGEPPQIREEREQPLATGLDSATSGSRSSSSARRLTNVVFARRMKPGSRPIASRERGLLVAERVGGRLEVADQACEVLGRSATSVTSWSRRSRTAGGGRVGVELAEQRARGRQPGVEVEPPRLVASPAGYWGAAPGSRAGPACSLSNMLKIWSRSTAVVVASLLDRAAAGDLPGVVGRLRQVHVAVRDARQRRRRTVTSVQRRSGAVVLM